MTSARKCVSPLRTYCAAVHLELHNPNLNPDFFGKDYSCSEIPLQQFLFFASFSFNVRSLYKTDQLTDGQDLYYGLLVWPHNKYCLL